MNLEIKDLDKKFGEKIVLNDISVTFKSGITGLLGPNGSGKTTLMRILSTIDKQTSGKIYFKGKDISTCTKEFRNKLGYLPQYFGVYPELTAVEFLEYTAALKCMNKKEAKEKIYELLDVLHLTHAMNKSLKTFSGGMKQRIGIAQALLNDPEILIIDEPTVGLDPEERIQFRNLLSSLARDKIIILSTHIVSDIEAIAPNITIIKNGNLLISSSPKELIDNAEGKVWKSVIPMDRFEEIQNRFLISNSMQNKEGIEVKIISKKRPLLNAEPTVPTLEDAYIYASSFREE